MCTSVQTVPRDGQRKAYDRAGAAYAQIPVPARQLSLPSRETDGANAVSPRRFKSARRAYGAVCSFSMDLHYLSCESGVGRKPKETNEERIHRRKPRDP